MVGTASSEVSRRLVVEEEVPQVLQLVLRGKTGVAAAALATSQVCLGLQVQERRDKEIMEGRGVLTTTILLEVVEVQALQARPPQSRNQGQVAQA
jgi:hypothetical protein